MGESPFRCGRTLGRPAAVGIAFAAIVLLTQAAVAQSRSPAGDKSGAKGLAGTVVQFEEKPSRAVLYLEEKGGLVTQLAPPLERESGDAAKAPLARKPAGKSLDVKAADVKAADKKSAGAKSADVNSADVKSPERRAALAR